MHLCCRNDIPDRGEEWILLLNFFYNVIGDIQSIQSNKRRKTEEKRNKDRCHNRSHLTVHMMKHTGEKPVQCSHCGKTINYISSLKEHQKIHTGEKSHQCSQCGKTFIHMSYLKKHQKIHTGEKPHQCSQCGKAFNQMSNLRGSLRLYM